MSADELAEYEEKKLKLRKARGKEGACRVLPRGLLGNSDAKHGMHGAGMPNLCLACMLNLHTCLLFSARCSLQAMGENLHDDVAGEAPDARERRLRMIAAVEGDNWSEVIQEQTAEAVRSFVVLV